jgi:hypothetical protein
VTTRRLFVAMALLPLAVAACQGAEADPPETTTTTVAPAPTTTMAPDESEVEPVPDVVTREWWQDLGLVITPETVGRDPLVYGVSDIKVALLPDGRYVATVASASDADPGGGRIHTLHSDDLVTWTEVASFDMQEMLDRGFYIGTLLALPDGTLKMIGVSDRPGDPVLSTTSTDQGSTWTAGPAPLLSIADFDHEVRLSTASVLALPEGGWRMYVSANDCSVTNLYFQDNCPEGEAFMTFGPGVESVYSAVSDDLVTWTLEPGVRFEGSIENGSMNHLHAWIDDDGRVRLTGWLKWSPAWLFPEGSPQPEDFPHLSQVVIVGALMELVSDDGITFDLADYRDYRFPVADPQVIRGPDGSFVLFVGSQGQDEIVERGDGEFDQRGGIRMFRLVTISWEIDPIVPFPISLQAWDPERPDEELSFHCYRIDVRGAGTVRFEVRADGWAFTPGSASEELYEIIGAVVEAPGSVYIKTHDRSDIPDRHLATNVVAIDEDGVSWFIRPFPMQEPAWEGEVFGYEDLASFPCPP